MKGKTFGGKWLKHLNQELQGSDRFLGWVSCRVSFFVVEGDKWFNIYNTMDGRRPYTLKQLE